MQTQWEQAARGANIPQLVEDLRRFFQTYRISLDNAVASIGGVRIEIDRVSIYPGVPLKERYRISAMGWEDEYLIGHLIVDYGA